MRVILVLLALTGYAAFAETETLHFSLEMKASCWTSDDEGMRQPCAKDETLGPQNITITLKNCPTTGEGACMGTWHDSLNQAGMLRWVSIGVTKRIKVLDGFTKVAYEMTGAFGPHDWRDHLSRFRADLGSDGRLSNAIFLDPDSFTDRGISYGGTLKIGPQ